MLKGLTKHENKEQGKTQHETSRSKNHKVTQSKNNTRTTALERSVAQATGCVCGGVGVGGEGLKHFYCRQVFTLGSDVILSTKIYKKFSSHNS